MRRRSHLVGVALTTAVILAAALGSRAAGAPSEKPSESWGTATVTDGRLSLDVIAAPLDGVLRSIAAQAGFELEVRGDLVGVVTAKWAPVPLGEGLLRLVQGLSASLTYAKGPDGREKIEHMLVVAAPATPTVTSTPSDATRSRELATIRRLARFPRSASTPALAEMLHDGSDPMVRSRAAAALGRLGDEAAITALTGALGDASPEVRTEALRALVSASGSRATPTLAGQLAVEPDPVVRREIVVLLGRSVESPEGRIALDTARRDSDPVVRSAAEGVLARWASTGR